MNIFPCISICMMVSMQQQQQKVHNTYEKVLFDLKIV